MDLEKKGREREKSQSVGKRVHVLGVRERSERACEVRRSMRRRAKGTNAEGDRERERERPPPLGAFEYARINA